MTEAPTIAKAVEDAISVHAHVLAVELVGSRARGSAAPLSDWDFAIRVDDVSSVAADLPKLVSGLEPLSEQWDRLGPAGYRCFMLMLAGPAKVDLIFPGEPHRPEPPWHVTSDTLEGMDRHFWDWILWMAAKDQAGRHELVHEELEKMRVHLLEPMGVRRTPGSIRGAVDAYVGSRAIWESAFDVMVPRRLQDEVDPVLPVR
jgi:predicted nucleotidyltransferase